MSQTPQQPPMFSPMQRPQRPMYYPQQRPPGMTPSSANMTPQMAKVSFTLENL